MTWILPILNTVAVTITIILTLYGLVVKFIFMRARKLMPELAYPDGGMPVLGHALEFASYCATSAELLDYIDNKCEYYKDGFQGTLGHQLWVFMPDQSVIQKVLYNLDGVEKNFIYTFLNCITEGVFISPGHKWRVLRKKLNLTFSAKQIDSYMDPVNNHTEIFVNKIVKTLSAEKEFKDIQPRIARYFFDVMAKTHYAVDTDEQVNNEHKINDITTEIIEYILNFRVVRPFLHNEFLFKMSSAFKNICKIRKGAIKYVETMVSQRKNDIRKGNDSSNGMLVFVDLAEDALKELNIPPTIENIQSNSADVLIAGSDTTSVAAAALLYFLAFHKDMQQKVYEEVSSVYGNDGYRPLTRQEINDMAYLDMAVNETLRWSTTVGIIKTFKKDYDAGKITIPKNGHMYVLMSSQHFNPDYYERPREFYPEHFTPEAVSGRSKISFMPFSHGLRNCPGRVFAYILIKACVAAVINDYFVETNLDINEVKYKIVLMTQHVQGYPLRFIPRKITS